MLAAPRAAVPRPWSNRRPGPLAATALGTVALLLLVAPALGAPATIVAPRYHGTVAPSDYQSVSGCGYARIAHPWSFGFGSGVARTATTGRSDECRGQGSTSSTSEVAQAGGGLGVTLPIPLASNSSSVEARLAWNYSVSLLVGDGLNRSSPACDATPSTFYDASTTYEWNYTHRTINRTNTTSYFADVNESSTDETNGIWSNATVGNAAPPSPFHRNATSYYDRSVSYGSSAACTAWLEADAHAQPYLDDRSTGAVYAPTASSFDATLFQVELYVTNQTFWSCGNSTLWDGPTHVANSTPLRCSSYNTTLLSVLIANATGTNGTTSNSSVGTRNSLSYAFHDAGAGAAWWNASKATGLAFSSKDRYALQLEFDDGFEATNDWKHGGSSWSFAMARGGAGYTLASVLIR